MAKSANGGIPAWMVCVDILNKAKRELVTQAVETLEKEVEAKRIDIKGSMLTVPDQSSDDEMKLFVIGQVLRNAEQMRERYGSYIKDVHTKGANATSQEIESAERARLFLMAVEKIEILVQYSRQLDTWINDASMEVTAGGSGQDTFKDLSCWRKNGCPCLHPQKSADEDRGCFHRWRTPDHTEDHGQAVMTASSYLVFRFRAAFDLFFIRLRGRKIEILYGFLEPGRQGTCFVFRSP